MALFGMSVALLSLAWHALQLLNGRGMLLTGHEFGSFSNSSFAGRNETTFSFVNQAPQITLAMFSDDITTALVYFPAVC